MISFGHANVNQFNWEARLHPEIAPLRTDLALALHDAQRHVVGGTKIIVLGVRSVERMMDEAPRLMLNVSSDHSHELRGHEVVFLQKAGMLGLLVTGHNTPATVMAVNADDYIDACIARGALLDSLINELTKLVQLVKALPRD